MVHTVFATDEFLATITERKAITWLLLSKISYFKHLSVTFSESNVQYKKDMKISYGEKNSSQEIYSLK